MAARLIGGHMPTSGGIEKGLDRGRAIGCTAIQVFTSSPQQWKPRDLTPETVSLFRTKAEELGYTGRIVSHDSYLVNLASEDPELREKSRTALTRELHRCSRLGIPWAVSHIGAHGGQGSEAGLQLAAEEVRQVLAESPADVTLLAETTAGQGSVLNAKFEEIARLIELVGGDPRLGVCLDTCHIFAAGYDISTDEGYDSTFAEFERLIGTERVKAVHANDSKHACGTRKDRHEHLGQGAIGERAFRRLVHDPRFELVPIVVETPESETHHAENVARLFAWAAEPL
ncbi:MAG: deoxyribonuclease IV [Fimbriimonadaceae bacterium]|nr:deoxyribonuclease IV [Fimbriimonadaceae bacterium]QYK56311.1 MAG: deoxyribonuclease IV [Fimbriimonadaceae bacterium]